ncbi:type II toxin-antitoxin system RelE/ParE family toxin [Pseudodesulfovibrio sp. JC047]|uniref:type II toxin-antitoxin system RelE/ParE family toxin n=1 Tax=Pseudodesulfovibrio sp. JC047 TaxID=2683199 RepID=UPI0013D5C1A1|nr:type II toxin-antitoxin system RelE/ParE family toxin [Pseudodesulfovibrio sp. JC047]NDV18629.1 type II toxin-antitoxin system RelE/ParE family toxin [Pseudodesulfovibrio sp. JC047]
MKVILAPCAAKDIEEIIQFIRVRDSREAAMEVLGRLEQTVFSLVHLPNRGSWVRELEALGLKSVREIHCSPYRILYEVQVDEVHVFCIADERRDMASLLERRILGA